MLLFFQTFTFYMVLPFALIIGAILLHYLFYQWANRKSPQSKDKLIGECWASVLVLLFLIQPTTTEKVFQMWQCQEIDGVNYLQADMSVICWKSEHISYSVFAAVMFVIIPLGVPVLGFVTLYRNRELLADPPFLAKFRFLYSGYKPQYWFWESLIHARKLVIIALSVFFTPAEGLQQSYSAIWLVLVALLVHAHASPFELKTFNNLEFVSLIGVYITLFSGLIFYIQSVINLSNFTDVLTFILLMVNIIVLLTFALVFVYYAVIVRSPKLLSMWQNMLHKFGGESRKSSRESMELVPSEI